MDDSRGRAQVIGGAVGSDHRCGAGDMCWSRARLGRGRMVGIQLRGRASLQHPSFSPCSRLAEATHHTGPLQLHSSARTRRQAPKISGKPLGSLDHYGQKSHLGTCYLFVRNGAHNVRSAQKMTFVDPICNTYGRDLSRREKHDPNILAKRYVRSFLRLKQH